MFPFAVCLMVRSHRRASIIFMNHHITERSNIFLSHSRNWSESKNSSSHLKEKENQKSLFSSFSDFIRLLKGISSAVMSTFSRGSSLFFMTVGQRQQQKKPKTK